MSDVLTFLALPFAASIIFVGIHAYLGLHVLRRGVVFADLALAQLSALGATGAFALGYQPGSPAGFAYALLLTASGAILLTLARNLARHVSQEAIVGILYVVASAATILLIDRSPQGAEHVKRMLVGSILTVTSQDIVTFAAIYGAIGVLHGLFRRPLLAASEGRSGAGWRAACWDLVFFLSFGLVVTSSVTAAGVLLVFSFLIIPAVIGTLFSQRLTTALTIGWGVGVAASAAGLVGSFLLDLPTGAAMVVAFALTLVLAGLVRVLAFGGSLERRRNRARLARAASGLLLILLLAASLWVMIWPTADQPLLALAETASGVGPEHFLSQGEREAFREAHEYEERYLLELETLNDRERRSRWSGERLSDEEVRRIGSYQQSYNEMARGERFVQDTLRGKARTRERWIVGVPGAMLSALGLWAAFGSRYGTLSWLRAKAGRRSFTC